MLFNLKQVTGSSVCVLCIYYFHAKLLWNEPTTRGSTAATYQVCSLKLSLEFYSVLCVCKPPQSRESTYTELLCDGERETLGLWRWVLLVNLLKQPITFCGFIWSYGAYSAILVLRDLAGGDGAKLGPYGECNQPGRPHFESCSKGDSATACFRLTIIEGGK